MKRLWISLIIASIPAAAFFFFFSYHHQHNVSELSSTETLGKPERIVSLAPNLTEILFALGLGEKIVAVSNNCDYPPQTTDKERIGTFWQPNTEAIIASRPELVVTLWFEQQKAVAETLKRLGYQVLTLKIEKIEELLTAIQEIGTAAGARQRADELVKDITNQLLVIERQLRLSSADKVKVLWVIQAEPLRVAGRNTFVNELVEAAGGENAIGPTIQQYPQIGTEELLVCGAETIIQSSMTAANIAEQQQAAEAFWAGRVSLPAVRSNKIYVVNSDTVLRLGPRLPQGIEMIARYLHPDIFEQTHGAARQVR